MQQIRLRLTDEQWRNTEAGFAKRLRTVGARIGFGSLGAVIGLALMENDRPVYWWFALMVITQLFDAAVLRAAVRRQGELAPLSPIAPLASCFVASLVFGGLTGVMWNDNDHYAAIGGVVFGISAMLHIKDFAFRFPVLFMLNMFPFLLQILAGLLFGVLGYGHATTLEMIGLLLLAAGFCGHMAFSVRHLTTITGNLVAEREKAVASDRVKSAFLANMSHELRTPLNAIIGYSELLGEELVEADHPAAIPDLDRIGGSARHLLELINDLLDHSKIEAEALTLDATPVDVDGILIEAVGMLRPVAEKSGTTLQLESKLVGFSSTDPVRLRQCLINIIGNAVKFTRDGSIIVRAERKADRLCFTVSDTGIGIAQDWLEAIFDPFVQQEVTISRQFGGTGLGLAISRKLARLMGGDLIVRSTVGVGSVFTLELVAPCADPPIAESSLAA